jgi:hypothetical protein
MLIGQGAYDLGQGTIMAHGSDIQTQCIYCHSASLPAQAQYGQSSTNFSGHTYQISFDACALCHITSHAAENAMTNTQNEIKLNIADVKGLLDQWATYKAPSDLQAKYGSLAWEYSTPGPLSNPTNNPALVGPTSAEQSHVPDAIKQARLNLYLVQNDGSFGVHNGQYARYLLDVATTNINAELNRP